MHAFWLFSFFHLIQVQTLLVVGPTAMDHAPADHEQVFFFRAFEEMHHMFDIGDFAASKKIGKSNCEKAKALKSHADFQEELAAVVGTLEKIIQLPENDRKKMSEVTKLRAKANRETTMVERARYLKQAALEYDRITDNKTDFFLLAFECEYLIAECQAFDAMTTAGRIEQIDSGTKDLEKRCTQAFGANSFVHTMSLSARLKLLQYKGEWARAAEVAKLKSDVFDKCIPGSFYHIQTLEDWAGSLAKAKKLDAARAVIERACEYADANDLYKYGDLGVMAHLIAGQIEFLSGRLAEAEEEYDKAQRIVEVVREGKISRNLIEMLDEYYIGCLVKRGRFEQAEGLRSRSKMRF